MDKFEAMRLYVKLVEEEHPEWWDLYQVKESSEAYFASTSPANSEEATQIELKSDFSSSTPVTGNLSKSVNLPEGLARAAAFNQWTATDPQGRRPRQRYQHASILIQDEMYVVGGNSWGRYFNDTQVLDLNNMCWNKPAASGTSTLHPCAGHVLVEWRCQVLLVGGHMKKEGPPCTSLSLLQLDRSTHTWTDLETTFESDSGPGARGGHSATLFSSSKLVVFGGEDLSRKVLDDVWVLDLATMKWTAQPTYGTKPAARADHIATAYLDRFLYVFGGGSSTRCFNDLYCLDLQTWTWTVPSAQGVSPSPRAGHCGALVSGFQWYITGGGDSTCGVADTNLLDLQDLTWSVAFNTSSRDSICSEGLSLVAIERGAEKVLVAFGGYNGKFTNDVYAFRICPPGGMLPQADVAATLEATIDSLRAELAEERENADERIRQVLLDCKAQEEKAEKQLNEIQAQLQTMQSTSEIVVAEVQTLSQCNAELEAEMAASLAIRAELEAAAQEDHQAHTQALQDAKSAADLAVSDTRARADAACLEMKQSELALETARARILELETLALESSKTTAALEVATSRATEAETKTFMMEVQMAELRNKMEGMEMLEHELEKCQKQLSTAKEEAQKRQAGGIWGMVTGS